jgi:hypothetical protein
VLTVATGLAQALPGLKDIDWDFHDKDDVDGINRTQERSAFTEGLRKLRFLNRLQATIEFHSEVPWDLRGMGENLVP